MKLSDYIRSVTTKTIIGADVFDITGASSGVLQKTTISAIKDYLFNLTFGTTTKGWKDLVSPFSAAKGNGTTEPVWSDAGNGLYAMKFTVNDELFVSFHVLHDWAVGNDSYLHVHFFCENALTVGQTVVWELSYIVAKGHHQGGDMIATPTVVELTYTADGTEIAGEHLIVEMSDAQAFDMVETDAVVKACVKLKSETVTGDIYGEMCDIHYLADHFATKNKAPDFDA